MILLPDGTAAWADGTTVDVAFPGRAPKLLTRSADASGLAGVIDDAVDRRPRVFWSEAGTAHVSAPGPTVPATFENVAAEVAPAGPSRPCTAPKSFALALAIGPVVAYHHGAKQTYVCGPKHRLLVVGSGSSIQHVDLIDAAGTSLLFADVSQLGLDAKLLDVATGRQADAYSKSFRNAALRNTAMGPDGTVAGAMFSFDFALPTGSVTLFRRPFGKAPQTLATQDVPCDAGGCVDPSTFAMAADGTAYWLTRDGAVFRAAP
jgi:hypothetical protein